MCAQAHISVYVYLGNPGPADERGSVQSTGNERQG